MNKKSFKSGFTLLELLVVVVIIGILAAIALPQYQKAVMKSRVTQVIPLIKAVAQAQDVYYLAHNEFAENIDSLDVDFTCPQDWRCIIKANGYDEISANYKTGTLGVVYHYGDFSYQNVSFSRKLYCYARITDKKAVDVCKSFGPQLIEDDTTDRYLIQ